MAKYKIGTKVVLKNRRASTECWTTEYNGMKCKVIEHRTPEEALDSCGDKDRIYRLEYERMVGSIRNGGFTGWFSAKEFNPLKKKKGA